MGSSDPRRDIVYRSIQALMLGDVVLGAVLAVVGWRLWWPALTVAGGGLAAAGIGLALFFGRLGRRAAAMPPASR